MGKYDIDSDYSEEFTLKMSDFIAELMSVHSPYDGNYDSFYHLLKNHDKSGLIDLLNSELEFDIEAIAGNSKLEKFNMFKLLKLLFNIEKVGAPKYKKGFEDTPKLRTPFIRILANPRTANIKTPYTTKTIHGDIFEEVFNAIKRCVADSEQRIACINEINEYWDYIIEKQFDYVISDMALEQPKVALEELKRIHRFLNKMLNQLEGNNPHTKSKPEGVLQTFFNIMLTHQKLCYERDSIQINYEICLCEKPSRRYTDLFLKYENAVVDYETIELVKRHLKHYKTRELQEKEAEKVDIILGFASYFKDIPDSDCTHYRYAFEKLETVAKWLENAKPNFNFTYGIPFPVLVTIIQEIVYLKKNATDNAISIEVTTIKPHPETLLSALKKDSSTKAILIQAWLTRIENRFSINFGSWELIEEKRKIETALYEIKSLIFEYRNIDDLLFVNSFLARFVGRSTTSRKYAMAVGNQFSMELANELAQTGVIVEEFLLFPEAKNTYDLFRYMLYSEDKERMISNVVKQVVDSIVESYRQTDSYCITDSAKITLDYNNGYCQNAVLLYSINKYDHTFEYKEFFMSSPDDIIDRYCSLGLEKFCVK